MARRPTTIRQNLAHARKRLKANLGKDYQIDPATSRHNPAEGGHAVSDNDDAFLNPDGAQEETVGEVFADYLGLVEETIRTQVTDDDIKARVRHAMDLASSIRR